MEVAGSDTINTRAFAILPAAGRSARMGTPKLLLSWNGGVVIERVLANWRSSGVSRIVVVTDPRDVELAAIVRGCGVDLVIAAQPPPEMKISIRHGIDYIVANFHPQEADVWLVAPADMPMLSPTIIDQVLQAHDPLHPVILAPSFQGRAGHPVLFPWKLAEEVALLGPEQGLNQLCQRHFSRQIAVDDPGILADLDTPEDYRRLLDAHAAGGRAV